MPIHVTLTATPTTAPVLTDLPGLFRMLILGYAFLLIAISIYLMYRNRRLSRDLNAAMIEAQERIRELDRCRIENLAPVLEALNDEDDDVLSDAGQRIAEDSERLYQSKWIPSPEHYLSPQELMGPGQLSQITLEPAFQLIALGLVGTAAAVLFALNFMQENRALALQFSLIATIAGVIAGILLMIQVYRIRGSVQSQSTSLARSIRRRVPVFEELSGTAALIESFVRYDRDMSASVEQLTTTVDDLSKNKMVELISMNLSNALRQELAPPLRDSQQSLALLARELMTMQAQGINEMSHAFVTELSTSLDGHLQSIVQRMEELAGRLETHSERFSAMQASLDGFAQQSTEQQTALQTSLDQLQAARQDLQADMTESRQINQKLVDTLAQLEAVHRGDLESITSSMATLGTHLTEHITALDGMQTNLAELGQGSQRTVEHFTRQSEGVLRQIRDQINEMQAQTASMNRSQAETAKHIANLNSHLESSVEDWGRSVKQHVDTTISSFDDGLGEVTERLAATTRDLRDSVDHMRTQIRLDDEVSHDGE